MVLAKMQMESDLVVRTSDNKSDKYLKHRAMGYGLALNFRLNGLKHYKYGGYDIQVYKACELFRRAFDRYKVGIKKDITDLKRTIEPLNAATYALYVYTPFYGVHNVYNWKYDAVGNMAFIKLYKDMKKKHDIIYKKLKKN
jgi:hypothetical protein